MTCNTVADKSDMWLKCGSVNLWHFSYTVYLEHIWIFMTGLHCFHFLVSSPISLPYLFVKYMFKIKKTKQGKQTRKIDKEFRLISPAKPFFYFLQMGTTRKQSWTLTSCPRKFSSCCSRRKRRSTVWLHLEMRRTLRLIPRSCLEIPPSWSARTRLDLWERRSIRALPITAGYKHLLWLLLSSHCHSASALFV